MRYRKKLAAGTRFLHLYVAGDRYGFHHYPHGLQTAAENSSSNNWLKMSLRQLRQRSNANALHAIHLFLCSIELRPRIQAYFATRFWLPPLLSPSTGLGCSWRLQCKIRGIQKVGQHKTSFFRPPILGGKDGTMLAVFHISTQENQGGQICSRK